MKDVTRFFDVILSFSGLVILSPILILISGLIKISSRGPIIFIQQRVGKNNRDFYMYKFRTMQVNAAAAGALTVANDRRITAVGYYLRKLKLDELPQLYNVLKGDMSMVGPRPELRRFVDMYDENQKIVLTVRPGITDYASIMFRNESNLLRAQENPEDFYIKNIIPIKIELNKIYLSKRNIFSYFSIIFNTIVSFKKIDKDKVSTGQMNKIDTPK